MRIIFPDGRVQQGGKGQKPKQVNAAALQSMMVLGASEPTSELNAGTMPMNISETGKPVWRQMIERLGDKINKYGGDNAGKAPFEETKDNPFWLRCAVGLTIYEGACTSNAIVPYIGEGETPTVRVPLKDETPEEEAPTSRPVKTKPGGKPTPVPEPEEASDGDDDLTEQEQAIIDVLSTAKDNRLNVKQTMAALEDAGQGFESNEALKDFVKNSAGLKGKVSLQAMPNTAGVKTNYFVLSLPAEEPKPAPAATKKPKPTTKPPKIVTPETPDPEAEADDQPQMDLLPGEHPDHESEDVLSTIKAANQANALGKNVEDGRKWFKGVFQGDHTAAHNKPHFAGADLTKNDGHEDDADHWNTDDDDAEKMHPPTEGDVYDLALETQNPYLGALLAALYSNNPGGVRSARKQFLSAVSSAKSKVNPKLTDGHGNQNKLQTYSTLADRVIFASPIVAKQGSKSPGDLSASYYLNFYQTLQSGSKSISFTKAEVAKVLANLKSQGWLSPAKLIGATGAVENSAMFLAKTKKGSRTRVFRLVARAVKDDSGSFGFDIDISLLITYELFSGIAPHAMAKIKAGKGWTAGSKDPASGKLPTSTAFQTLGKFAAMIAQKGTITAALNSIENTGSMKEVEI